jgi:predicted ferric reductase
MLQMYFAYDGAYNFLIDYFEEFHNEVSKKQVKDLLEWWNQYVFFIWLSTCSHLTLFFRQHVFTIAASNESQDLLIAQQDQDYD